MTRKLGVLVIVALSVTAGVHRGRDPGVLPECF